MTPSDIAKSYIGETEKPNNAGFNNAEFEAKMKAVGFMPSHSWCCYFTELVFKEAFPLKVKGLDKIFSASCVHTFNNLKGFNYNIRQTPQVDDLVLWQMHKSGEPQPTGHAGIVVRVIDATTFETVEGNTNNDGGREGYIVAKKVRKIKKVFNGLQILGFIKL